MEKNKEKKSIPEILRKNIMELRDTNVYIEKGPFEGPPQ